MKTGPLDYVLSYGLLTALLLAVIRRFTPYPVGEYSMDSAHPLRTAHLPRGRVEPERHVGEGLRAPGGPRLGRGESPVSR